MNKAYTFEVVKRIVVTVEADAYMRAVCDVNYDLSEGEYSYSFERAEPVLTLLDEVEVDERDPDFDDDDLNAAGDDYIGRKV